MKEKKYLSPILANFIYLAISDATSDFCALTICMVVGVTSVICMTRSLFFHL